MVDDDSPALVQRVLSPVSRTQKSVAAMAAEEVVLSQTDLLYALCADLAAHDICLVHCWCLH